MKEIILVPDNHTNYNTNNWELALYEKFEPDAYVHEGSLGNREILESIASNYTLRDVYDNLNLDSEETGFSEEAMEVPLYKLDVEPLTNLGKLVDHIDPIEHVDVERFEDRAQWIEELEEYRTTKSEVEQVINYAKDFAKGNSSNFFNFIFAKSLQENDYDTRIRLGDDKDRAAEIAVEKFDELPSDTNLVSDYLKSIRESLRWSDEETGEIFLRAIQDEDVQQARDKSMADSLMKEDDEEKVIGRFGADHIEGVLEALPGNHKVRVFDLQGVSEEKYSNLSEAIYQPEEWLEL